MNDFDEVVQKAIDFWIGKPNNPLNGMTFKEIYDAVKRGDIKYEDC